MNSGRLLAIASLTGVALTASPAALGQQSPKEGTDPSFLTLGTGIWDVSEENHRQGMLRMEYRHGERYWIFKPFFGFEANFNDGAFYGYAGIGTDLYFGSRWVVTPNFAVGGFSNGTGKNMGHALEFRSGIELAYRFDDYSRLGFAVHHISNANIGDKNPGIESLTLNYSVPFGRILDWIP